MPISLNSLLYVFYSVSGSTMETDTENGRPNNGQLISVTHRDTIRLLEVYVKRSLSLNDGTLDTRKTERRQKWVTTPKKRMRRHSSDPSVYLGELPGDGEIATFAAVETPTDKLETLDDEPEKTRKKSKKNKKPSLWKSFLGLFVRKGSEENHGEQDNPLDTPDPLPKDKTPDTPATGLPTTTNTVQRRKSTKKKSKRKRLSRLSLKRLSKADISKDVNPADISGVESKSEN